MIEMQSVYRHDGSVSGETIDFLYDLLAERDETTNISHQVMPERPAHILHVMGRPYKEWWILVDNGVRVGAMYLSKYNEIGIFILKAYRGKGRGPKSIVRLIKDHGTAPLYSNINPRNYPSIAMFESLNFRHIQNTYRWDPPE